MKKILIATIALLSASLGNGAISSGTVTIGTGGDYSGLSAFESALAGTLTSSVTAYILNAFTDTTVPYFQGTVTASTSPITVFVNTAARGDTTPGTGYVLGNGTAQQLRGYDNHLNFFGLKMDNVFCNTIGDGRQHRYEECYLYNCTGVGVFYVSDISTSTIYNCFVSSSPNMYGITVTGAGTLYMAHTTMSGVRRGLNSAGVASKLVLKNNCITDTSQATFNVYGYALLVASANVSSDANSPNTEFRNMTPIYVSSTTYDFRLDDTDTVCGDTGVDLSGDTDLLYPLATDFLLTSRPQGAGWDIGAHERTESAPPSPAPSVPMLPQVLIWKN